MIRWWMSFCDPAAPPGSKFLGLCIVEAVDETSAHLVANIRGLNPGGEVAFMPIDETIAKRLSFDLGDYQNRFLPPADADALVARIAAEMES